MRLVLLLFFALIPSLAWAQTVDTGQGLHVDPPKGWESAEPSKGVAALFRLPGDPKTRVELRAAKVENSDQAQRYFKSYHASLLAKGLVQKERSEQTYAERKGTLTRYAGTSGEETFELTLFEFEEGTNAWFVIGFATGKRVEAMNAAFIEVASSIKAPK